MRSNALLSWWIQKPLGLSTRSLNNAPLQASPKPRFQLQNLHEAQNINPLPHHSLLTVLLISPGEPRIWQRQTGEELQRFPLMNEGSATWLTYLWIMCFLRGHSGHVWWMALQKPGQLAGPGFPPRRAAAGTRREPTSVTRLGCN